MHDNHTMALASVGLCLLMSASAMASEAAAKPSATAAKPSASAATAGVASEDAAAASSATKLATHRYRAGQFKKAAALYHEAFGLDPKASFLFNAARAEMRNFDYVAAKRDFNRYLAAKDATTKGRSRARMHLQEISAFQDKISEQKRLSDQRATTAAAAARAQATRPLGVMTTALWIGAGTLLVGSGSLYGVAAILRGNTNRMEVDTQAEKDRHDSQIRNQDGLRNGAVLLLLGAAGLGAWAYKRTRDQRQPIATTNAAPPGLNVRLAPWGDGRGFSLLGRF